MFGVPVQILFSGVGFRYHLFLLAPSSRSVVSDFSCQLSVIGCFVGYWLSGCLCLLAVSWVFLAHLVVCSFFVFTRQFSFVVIWLGLYVCFNCFSCLKGAVVCMFYERPCHGRCVGKPLPGGGSGSRTPPVS